MQYPAWLSPWLRCSARQAFNAIPPPPPDRVLLSATLLSASLLLQDMHIKGSLTCVVALLLSAHRQVVLSTQQCPCWFFCCGACSARLASLEHPLAEVFSLAGLDAGPPDTPLLFLHGVGGLPGYLELLLHLMATQHPIIAVEFKCVSARLG